MLLFVGFLVVVQFSPSLTRGEQTTSSERRTAPEFAGISAWLNSPPLTMESLRGKVVLVQFWTYSCINCVRTLPYVTKWYDTYKDKGFVVVGVHTPEFAFERETANVETAIKRFGIKYPVAQDNQYRTWRAFGNQYWPAGYLIDKSGTIVATQFGEGDYQQMENTIARLVGEPAPAAQASDPDLAGIETPELYLGSEKNDGAIVASQDSAAGERSYALPDSVPQNRFALDGGWKLAGDQRHRRRQTAARSCSASMRPRSIWSPAAHRRKRSPSPSTARRNRRSPSTEAGFIPSTAAAVASMCCA